jgi:branched-chain amino acid transport system permease protein
LGPLGVFAIASVAAGVIPLVGSDYAVLFSIQLLIFLVLAYSWNLIGGYTGYSHFGQVAFFGIGAYVGALLIFHWNVPWYLAALAAALAGAIIALPLGGAMLRLKGPFFAIGMFVLARVLEAFALGFDGITQGGTGIYLKPLGDLKPLYYVVAAVAAVMMLLTWRLDNSRRLWLLAIREDGNAAESLGIPTTRLKIGAFVVGRGAAAMGCLYSVYLGFIRRPLRRGYRTHHPMRGLLGGMGTCWAVIGRHRAPSSMKSLGQLSADLPRLVGVIVLPLCSAAGLVSYWHEGGWLALGRPLFRRRAAREPIVMTDPILVVGASAVRRPHCPGFCQYRCRAGSMTG